jgi:signal transduction histidine kinase
MRLPLLFLLAVSLASVAMGQSDSPGATPSPSSTPGPQAIVGTVSLIDESRHLVVLQERGRATRLTLDPIPVSLRLGERVAVEGKFVPPLAASEGPSAIGVAEPRITPLGKGDLDSPRIRMDRPWPDERDFTWVEVEGIVSFIAIEGDALVLELTDTDSRAAGARMNVRILDWGGRSTAHLLNRRLRVRGVCEQTVNARGERTAGLLWVQEPRQIELRDMENQDWRDLEPIAMSDLTPENVNLSSGQKVLVRATVIKHDKKSGAFFVRGEDSFEGFISSDGRDWESVGSPVSAATDDAVAVGLVVSAAPDDAVATFDHVSWSGNPKSEESVERPLLPFLEGTHNSPLGKERVRGKVDIRDAGVTIRPGGARDEWAAADEGQFVFRELKSGGEIVARLKSFQSGDPSDKAGLMMRESRDADAANVALIVTHGTRVDLLYRQARGAVSRRVGRLTSPTPLWLKLVRRQHTLTARVVEGETLPLNKTIELLGTVGWEEGRPVLLDAYERRLRKRAEPEKIVITPTGAQEVLIVDLPSEEAESRQFAGEKFRIRGVVTFKGRVLDRDLLFVQDDSGGALLHMQPQFTTSQPLEVGQTIEAEGRVAFSADEPPFGLSSARVLGQGQLPRPLTFPDRLGARQADGNWVEVSGVVRSFRDVMMLVMGKEGLVPVWVGGLGSSNMLEKYVDAAVTLRGVFTMQLPDAPVLLVPSPQFIQVKEAASGDAFAIPSHPIDKVRARGTSAQSLRRDKVTGVVTYRDGDVLCVQDASGGAKVLAEAPDDLVVGESVEAIGFPDRSGESLTLTEALVRRISPQPLPAPAEMSLDDMLAGRLDATLVRLEGVVLDQKTREGRETLELQSGRRAFTAMLATNADRLPAFRVGSRVSVTGVNQLQFANRTTGQFPSTPATMDVLLRSPEDVVLLQSPPWWNWRYTAGVAAVLAGILIGSLVWIRTLRRRVDERTNELKVTMGRLQKETEVSATLAERDRLAAEIHDTLEQGLSGIMMQLDGVDSQLKTNPDGARSFLEMARRMVRFSRGEVRNSLWNLESSLLENGNLGAALKEIGKQMSAGDTVKVNVEVFGAAHPLPPAVEHHLLRCAQEALNNALKHAGASAIEIRLSYGENAVRLDVTDNGRGFEPESVLTEAGKSLGLRNLRSRSRKIKAQLEVVSSPGRGTAVRLIVPLPASADKPTTPDSTHEQIQK